MFIRVKKRANSSGKTYEYAYLVVNKYRKRKKTPKQKVKQYLGRVYRFENLANNEIETLETTQNSYKESIILLIKNELKNLGFEEKEGFWSKENTIVHLEQALCLDLEGKNICIAVNEGFLHHTTLKELIDFRPKEGLERDIGKQLGNALISAGIKPKEAVFIELFRQVMRQINDDSRRWATTSNNTKQYQAIPSNNRQQQATTGNNKQ